VLGLILLGGYLAFGLGGIFKPVAPPVILPGEPVWPGAPISNTLLTTFIVDLILILIAFLVVRGGRLIPSGFYGFVEWLVEFLWNTTESAAGKWASKSFLGLFSIFSIMATIFLLVFTANMLKLLPGFETIGYVEHAEGTVKGYEEKPLIGESVVALDGAHEVKEGEGEGVTVIPFLRAPATDLNFTFALAVAAVVMTQVFGLWALGGKYLVKFFNAGTMISKPLFGVIDFGVSLLELISEFAKILSFGFRLFGNIFAGTLLLSILGALTVVIVPSALYGLEFFVGIIQAYVFSVLSLTFMSQATVSHHGDEEHAAGGAH
jgi:F-type H+-transporting ATPase subunit a